MLHYTSSKTDLVTYCHAGLIMAITIVRIQSSDWNMTFWYWNPSCYLAYIFWRLQGCMMLCKGWRKQSLFCLQIALCAEEKKWDVRALWSRLLLFGDSFGLFQTDLSYWRDCFTIGCEIVRVKWFGICIAVSQTHMMCIFFGSLVNSIIWFPWSGLL